MHIQATHHGGHSTIHIFGELDNHTASRIREEIDNFINLTTNQDIVYDFENLSFMDSTGIGLLLGRYKKYQNNKKFYIKNVNSTIDRILTMSGVYKVIKKLN